MRWAMSNAQVHVEATLESTGTHLMYGALAKCIAS
jgi:hypothetical protein